MDPSAHSPFAIDFPASMVKEESAWELSSLCSSSDSSSDGASKQCAVCLGPAKFKHYGVIACEACSGMPSIGSTWLYNFEI